MKRKSICILLCVLLTASLFGCSATDVSVSFSTVKPWENAGYEKCTYSVERIYTGDGGSTVVATGKYTLEIRTTDTTHVENKFTLDYNDNDRADTIDVTGRTVRNKGMHDEYTGEVTFQRDSMVPIEAKKAFTLQQRPLNDGELFAYEESPAEGIAYRYQMNGADFCGDPQGYSYTVNYSTNEASFTTYLGSTVQENGTYYRNYTEKTKSFTVGSGTRYDNEQLPYIVRALSGMQAKGSATFYLTNMTDSYVQNGYVRHTMGLSCADKTTAYTLKLPEGYFLRNKEVALTPNELGAYSVPCVSATISLSDAKSGPPINMLITDPSIAFVRHDNYEKNPDGTDKELAATNRVIVQMTYTEYSLTAARIAYKTVYTLTDYVSGASA